MTTIYLIRHAQAQGNLEQRFQGSMDQPLSELGRQQLPFLSQRCRSLPVTQFYTSPLQRTLDTAAAANAFLGLPVTVEADLREIHCGDWENRKFDEIEQLWPIERKIWKEQPWDFQSPGGESMAQVYDRVTAALKQMERRHPDGCVAAVCHGCVLRNVLAFVRGGLHRYGEESEWACNASLSCITLEQGRPELVLFNQHDFLPEALRTC